jgi:hypothetical protein
MILYEHERVGFDNQKQKPMLCAAAANAGDLAMLKWLRTELHMEWTWTTYQGAQ